MHSQWPVRISRNSSGCRWWCVLARQRWKKAGRRDHHRAKRAETEHAIGGTNYGGGISNGGPNCGSGGGISGNTNGGGPSNAGTSSTLRTSRPAVASRPPPAPYKNPACTAR